MTGQPLRQDGDLASICFGDVPPSPAQRRLLVEALSNVAASEAAAREDNLPPELLRAALVATTHRPGAVAALAAAGTVRGSRFATWTSLAAGVAIFCLASWLIVQPSIDRGSPVLTAATPGNLPMADEAADIRLVPLTPELRRGLRRFADDPAGSRQGLAALLPGVADRAQDIVLSDRLRAVLEPEGAASAVRVERRGRSLRLLLPEETP